MPGPVTKPVAVSGRNDHFPSGPMDLRSDNARSDRQNSVVQPWRGGQSSCGASVAVVIDSHRIRKSSSDINGNPHKPAYAQSRYEIDLPEPDR